MDNNTITLNYVKHNANILAIACYNTSEFFKNIPLILFTDIYIYMCVCVCVCVCVRVWVGVVEY